MVLSWTSPTFANIMWAMTDLTPVGRLFEDTRKRLGFSQNEAARRGKTSATTYRNVIRGYAEHGGNRVPFKGADDTVAGIARGLEIDSVKLRQAGRVEAADILLDSEVRAKHGHKSDDQLRVEKEKIAAEIIEIMRGRGIEEGSEGDEILGPWVDALSTAMAKFDPGAA